VGSSRPYPPPMPVPANLVRVLQTVQTNLLRLTEYGVFGPLSLPTGHGLKLASFSAAIRA
jgi:hypothetical protein